MEKLKEFNEKEFLETLEWMGNFPIKKFIKEYIKEKTFGLVNEEEIYKKLITVYELYKQFPNEVIYFYNPHEYRKQNFDKIEIDNETYVQVVPVIDANRGVFKFMFENYDDLKELLKLHNTNTFVSSNELKEHLERKDKIFISEGNENETSTFSRHLKTNSFKEVINYFKDGDQLKKWYEFELEKYNDQVIRDEEEKNMDPLDQMLLNVQPSPIKEQLEEIDKEEKLKEKTRSR